MWSGRGSRAIFYPACLEKRGALSVEDATYKTKKMPFLRVGGFKRFPVLLTLPRTRNRGSKQNLEMEHNRMTKGVNPEQKSKPVALERVTHATGNEAYRGAPALEEEYIAHSELETTWRETNPTPKRRPSLRGREGAPRATKRNSQRENSKNGKQ